MNKFALIPSRTEKDINSELVHFFEEAGFVVDCLIEGSSIYEKYDSAIQKHKVLANDIVVMCHDDIEILTKPSAFSELLEASLSIKDVGFVGLAGTKLLKQSAVWWDGIGKEDHFAGMVAHGTSVSGMNITQYGPYGPVVALDGVFLAAKGKTLNSIQLKKPKTFPANWDFYDIFYTFQTYRKKLMNFTVPIQIRHESPGNPRDDWNENRNAFVDMFIRELPATFR
tara:strand:- start:721 stop:1398 length:678 start_codon:yes stop_codon:yes gene_type:complete